MSTLHIIAAIDSKGAIGRDGDMLFHLSADLRRFKALTMGHTVVMGRRTFESLPKGALPGRQNIVVSRNPAWQAPGAKRADSLEQALDMCSSDSDTYIIGGGQIYTAAMPLATQLDLTVIDANGGAADTFFPPLPLDEFETSKIEIADTTPTAKFYTLRRKIAN